MRVTTFTCDRCGEAVDGSAHLHAVGVVLLGEMVATSLDGKRIGYGICEARPVLRAEWCNRCCMETGLQQRRRDDLQLEKPPEPLTLDEVVRELVREEIENSNG